MNDIDELCEECLIRRTAESEFLCAVYAALARAELVEHRALERELHWPFYAPTHWTDTRG